MAMNLSRACASHTWKELSFATGLANRRFLSALGGSAVGVAVTSRFAIQSASLFVAVAGLTRQSYQARGSSSYHIHRSRASFLSVVLGLPIPVQERDHLPAENIVNEPFSAFTTRAALRKGYRSGILPLQPDRLLRQDAAATMFSTGQARAQFTGLRVDLSLELPVDSIPSTTM
jgi:hypothetical protein